MGQKVNPHGLRVGVIKDWSSRWYSKDETFGDTIVSDYNLRRYLKKRLMQAGRCRCPATVCESTVLCPAQNRKSSLRGSWISFRETL